MNNPKWRCTIAIATSMLHAMPNAATRLSNPRISPIPPKNSAHIARNANGAGIPAPLREEAHGGAESIAAEPSQHLLRAVREEYDSKYEPQ